jgi:hypothetical protein
MYPFLALAPLSANVKHAAMSQFAIKRRYGFASLYAKLSHCKSGFIDASRFCSGPENISFRRDVVRGRYPLSFIKKTIPGQHHSELYASAISY